MVDRNGSAFGRNIEVGQTLEDVDQVPVSGGIIGIPVFQIPWDSAVVDQPNECEIVVLLGLSRKPEKVIILALKEHLVILGHQECGEKCQEWKQHTKQLCSTLQQWLPQRKFSKYTLGWVHSVCQNWSTYGYRGVRRESLLGSW